MYSQLNYLQIIFENILWNYKISESEKIKFYNEVVMKYYCDGNNMNSNDVIGGSFYGYIGE